MEFSEKVVRAYAEFGKFKEGVTKGECPDYLKCWEELYNELIGVDIENIDVNDEFIDKYFIGKRANYVAAEGMAVMGKENFKTFMKDELVAGMLKKMIKLAKQNLEKSELRRELNKIEFLKRLSRSGFKRATPWLYANRVLITLFPEVLTCIANKTDIQRTCDDLGINFDADVEEVFINAQNQIRSKVEDYLESIGVLENMNKFEVAGVCWYINNTYNI